MLIVARTTYFGILLYLVLQLLFSQLYSMLVRDTSSRTRLVSYKPSLASYQLLNDDMIIVVKYWVAMKIM